MSWFQKEAALPALICCLADSPLHQHKMLPPFAPSAKPGSQEDWRKRDGPGDRDLELFCHPWDSSQPPSLPLLGDVHNPTFLQSSLPHKPQTFLREGGKGEACPSQGAPGDECDIQKGGFLGARGSVHFWHLLSKISIKSEHSTPIVFK